MQIGQFVVGLSLSITVPTRSWFLWCCRQILSIMIEDSMQMFFKFLPHRIQMPTAGKNCPQLKPRPPQDAAMCLP